MQLVNIVKCDNNMTDYHVIEECQQERNGSGVREGIN